MYKRLLLFSFALYLASCGGGGGGISGTTSQVAVTAVRQGLAKTELKGRCRGYTVGLADLGIQIVTGSEVAIDPYGNPAIKRPCGDYCGTGFDHDGSILVSGYYDPDRDTVVLPYVPGHEAYLELTAEYEGEHALLKRNDRMEYERTFVHRNGEGHPIIPDCPAPKPAVLTSNR